MSKNEKNYQWKNDQLLLVEVDILTIDICLVFRVHFVGCFSVFLITIDRKMVAFEQLKKMKKLLI